MNFVSSQATAQQPLVRDLGPSRASIDEARTEYLEALKLRDAGMTIWHHLKATESDSELAGLFEEWLDKQIDRKNAAETLLNDMGFDAP